MHYPFKDFPEQRTCEVELVTFLQKRYHVVCLRLEKNSRIKYFERKFRELNAASLENICPGIWDKSWRDLDSTALFDMHNDVYEWLKCDCARKLEEERKERKERVEGLLSVLPDTDQALVMSSLPASRWDKKSSTDTRKTHFRELIERTKETKLKKTFKRAYLIVFEQRVLPSRSDNTIRNMSFGDKMVRFDFKDEAEFNPSKTTNRTKMSGGNRKCGC